MLISSLPTNESLDKKFKNMLDLIRQQRKTFIINADGIKIFSDKLLYNLISRKIDSLAAIINREQKKLYKSKNIDIEEEIKNSGISNNNISILKDIKINEKL